MPPNREMSEHRTLNIQHRSPGGPHPTSMFDVRRSMLDVRIQFPASRPLSRPRLPPERDSSRQPRNGIVRFPASRQVAMISSEVERRPARALHNPRGRRLPRARLHLSTRGQSRAHFLRHPLPQTLGTQHTKVRARMPGGPHGDLSEAGLTVSMPVPPRDSTPKRPLSSLRSIDIRELAFPLEPLDDPGPVAAFFHLLKSRLIGGLLKRSG